VITEGIYDNRFKYVNELRKMGAEVQVDGRVAVIEGGRGLSGALVHACDLRAGAAMVIAGMAASGETVIEDVHFIERGYERFVEKLSSLGADISVRYGEEQEMQEKLLSIS
jgi:UDP-N-acetylglucosamine 1-carboxyvinyltransferase